MRFSAAIFDMDGLLIDSERVLMHHWRTAARELGRDVAEHEYLACVGRAAPESDAILAGLMGSRELMDEVRRRVIERLHGDGVVFPLRRGAQALLDALATRGVRRAVASSSRIAEVRHRLATVQVDHHFGAFAGGDEVPRGKPDPAVYRLAAERLGVDPAQCLAFEDSMPGATAALAAGMQVVVVPDLKAPTPEVAARSHAVLASLDEALPHVGAWFA